MKTRSGNIFISVLLGVVVASLLGFTVDQILNNVYIPGASPALRVTVTGGSGPGTGTVTSTGTASHLASFTTSTNIGNYAGSACAAGLVATSIGVDGVVACVPAGSTNITNVTGGVFLVANKSTTGTTINRLAKLDTTASPATAVIAGTSDTTNILGLCVKDCGTTGTATILSVGLAPCEYDNTATVGHYVIVSTATAGKCSDSGSATTFPTGVAVLGRVQTTGDTSAARSTAFNTPDVASASSGPNGKGVSLQVDGSNTKVIGNLNSTTPAATGNGVNVDFQESSSGNTSSVSAQIDPSLFAKLAYSSALNITGIAAVSSSASVAATTRIESCTSGASAITRTLPAATGTGRVITLVKIDSGAGTCIFGRAGSDTLNGATTKTLATQYTGEHCIDIASALWYCEGAGT